MSFPPQFDWYDKLGLTYPKVLNLDRLDVFYYDSAGDYFNVTGPSGPFGYGKHGFYLGFNYPNNKPYRLKDRSHLLFEFKDVDGKQIWSGRTPIGSNENFNINGSALIYMWVKSDPLLTHDDITDGRGTLTAVAELDGVPN